MVDAADAIGKARAAVTERAELPGMSLMEHLDELRRRIVHSALYLGAGFGVSWIFRDRFVAYIQAPLNQIGKSLVFTHPMDAFNLQLQVSLRLYNEADELLLHIERNEWVSGDALPWDIEADWQLMVLRQRARQITISIDARSIPMRVKGEFYRSGRRLPLEEKCISMDHKRGVTLSELAFVGMVLELHLNDGGFSFGPSPNVASGVLISWPNRRERLWQAKEAWRKIKAERTATSRVHGV